MSEVEVLRGALAEVETRVDECRRAADDLRREVARGAVAPAAVEGWLAAARALDQRVRARTTELVAVQRRLNAALAAARARA